LKEASPRGGEIPPFSAGQRRSGKYQPQPTKGRLAMSSWHRSPCALAGALVFLAFTAPARADVLLGAYTPLVPNATVDLTAQGTLDWVKFGTDNSNNHFDYFTATKIGNPVFNPVLTPIGPTGTTLEQFSSGSGPGPVNFTWTDGNFGMGYPGSSVPSVNSLVSETILPATNSYPLGLGAEFTANAASTLRVMDVYVQGFNSVMTVTASLSGGLSTSTDVTPTVIATTGNYFSYGVYQIEYSASSSETLTVSVQTKLNQPSNPRGPVRRRRLSRTPAFSRQRLHLWPPFPNPHHLLFWE
jgi:hypothetical protein